MKSNDVHACYLVQYFTSQSHDGQASGMAVNRQCAYSCPGVQASWRLQRLELHSSVLLHHIHMAALPLQAAAEQSNIALHTVNLMTI